MPARSFTAAQFLMQSGFGQAPAGPRAFPEYPDLDAQLQMLFKLAPTAPELRFVQAGLERARNARVAADAKREQLELRAAGQALQAAFRRRTVGEWWPVVRVVLLLVAVGALLVWWQQRQKRLPEPRSNDRLPLPEPGGDDDDSEDD